MFNLADSKQEHVASRVLALIKALLFTMDILIVLFNKAATQNFGFCEVNC